MAGIMWMGLLWYLNFVQTPTVPKIEPAEHRAAITKFIAPNVLFWFRYAALATVVLRPPPGAASRATCPGADLPEAASIAIGIGMWLALIMAFNVWFIIWPNQQKVLGLVEASADEKAAAARLAGMTSRINTMLSIPMLYCMVAQQNAGPLIARHRDIRGAHEDGSGQAGFAVTAGLEKLTSPPARLVPCRRAAAAVARRPAPPAPLIKIKSCGRGSAQIRHCAFSRTGSKFFANHSSRGCLGYGAWGGA